MIFSPRPGAPVVEEAMHDHVFLARGISHENAPLGGPTGVIGGKHFSVGHEKVATRAERRVIRRAVCEECLGFTRLGIGEDIALIENPLRIGMP